MSATPEDVRRVVFAQVADGFEAKGVAPDGVADDFDLLLEGVIDSFGLLELITAVEHRFGVHLDFEQLDPDEMTRVGPFCRYVAGETAKAA